MHSKINEIISILEDDSAIEILKESEKCFKIGADRAALLFAFNSLLQALKNTAIKAGKPKDVNEGYWKSFYNDLLNDDRMENRILKEINNSESKFFAVDEGLRKDMDYWKARRNSCAHWKTDDDISSVLVESFYSFYLKNLYKFQLCSSIEQVIKDLRDNYDVTKTRPGTSPDRIIRRINYSIKYEEFNSLLTQIEYNYSFWNSSSENPIVEITKSMYEILDEKKEEMLSEKIRTSPEWASLFLSKQPRFFFHIYHSKNDFFELIKTNSSSCCQLFLIFEKEKLFSNQPQDNDYERFYNFILENRISSVPTEIYTDAFYNYIKSNLSSYFDGYSWLKDNSRCDNLINVLTLKKPDLEILTILNNHYSNQFSSQFFLVRLQYSIAKKFNKELLNIASINNIEITNKLLTVLQNNS